jgi:hypothetical protein
MWFTGRRDPDRLMKLNVERRVPPWHEKAIFRNGIVRANPVPQDRHTPIDGDTSFLNEGIRLAPRARSLRSEKLIDPNPTIRFGRRRVLLMRNWLESG